MLNDKKRPAPSVNVAGQVEAEVGTRRVSRQRLPREIKLLQRSLDLHPLRPLTPVEINLLRAAAAGIDPFVLEELRSSLRLGVSPLDPSPSALRRLLRHTEGVVATTDEVAAFYGWLHPASPAGIVDGSRHVHVFASSPPGWSARLPHPDVNWCAYCCFLLFRLRVSNAHQKTPVTAGFSAADIGPLGIEIGEG